MSYTNWPIEAADELDRLELVRSDMPHDSFIGSIRSLGPSSLLGVAGRFTAPLRPRRCSIVDRPNVVCPARLLKLNMHSRRRGYGSQSGGHTRVTPPVAVVLRPSPVTMAVLSSTGPASAWLSSPMTMAVLLSPCSAKAVLPLPVTLA